MITEVIQFTGTERLRYAAIALPDLGPDDVLIETRACGICMREVHVFSGRLPRNFPDVMGHEPVGVVAAVGAAVRHVRPGDAVAALGDHCLARHFVTSSEQVVRIPAPQNFAEMIAEPAMCAVSAIRCSGLEPGDSVVVIGCGYMGLLLIQALSRTLNRRLVAVDLSPQRLELARAFGADETVLAQSGDTARQILAASGGTVDVVFEASGAERSLQVATEITRKGGTLCLFGHHTGPRTFSFDDWHMKGIKVLNTVPWMSKNLIRDFRDAVSLMVKGVFRNGPLITHAFDFSEAEQAMRISCTRPDGYIKSVITMKSEVGS